LREKLRPKNIEIRAYENAIFLIFTLIFKGDKLQCHIFLFMLNLKSKFVFDNGKFILKRKSSNSNYSSNLLFNREIDHMPLPVLQFPKY